MKKTLPILAALFLTGSAISTAGADEGKNVFLQKCGSCHTSGGEAQGFAPTKFAGIQWQRFFEKNRHASKKDITGIFSPSDLAAVRDYLVKHAADSEQPESLGVR